MDCYLIAVVYVRLKVVIPNLVADAYVRVFFGQFDEAYLLRAK
jgi:hypothetical protein